MKIRIGTRGSQLALWQTHYVADLLKHGGFETEIVKIETKGDKKQDVTIAEIGTRGVFTEEIEEQLKQGNIDIAVHSAKDMQSELSSDFELIAFTKREKENDVLVSLRKDIDLEKEHPWVLGTSSARRKAMLRHYYPHVKVVEMRGNLQTRMAKMEAGACDAMLLAYAGVYRMDFTEHIIKELSIEQFIPAVGQGSITIEALRSLSMEKKEKVRQLVNHTETEVRLLAERAFLKTLRGGCSVPVFALAQLEGEDLVIKGGVISLDGRDVIQELIRGKPAEAVSLGEKLAQAILHKGGGTILEEIKRNQNIKY